MLLRCKIMKNNWVIEEKEGGEGKKYIKSC